LAKAILDGKKTINAKIFEKFPPDDWDSFEADSAQQIDKK
jgi:hypothetical protein